MIETRAPKDFYFQWHFTEKCNLRCTHCYQNGYAASELNDHEIHSIAEMIESALRSWKRLGRISVTGGEPFLRRERLYGLLDRFAHSPFIEWLGILTNGTLIRESDASRLAAVPKLREVQVSIDGAKAQTHDEIRGEGVFAKATAALRMLRTYDVPTSIMFTLTATNIREVNDIVDLALELGVGALTVERMMPVGQGKLNKPNLDSDEIKDAFHLLSRRRRALGRVPPLRIRTSRPLWCLTSKDSGGFCPAGLNSLCILHDGTLLPCRRLEIPVGNLFVDGLYKTWYTSKVLWDLRQRNRLRADCVRCEYLGKCGGCRAAAHAWSGDYLGDDPHCWKRRDVASGR